MTKKEVQKRVLQNGKPISLNKFTWCEKTNAFSSIENYLVIDFKFFDFATINAGSSATINAGNSATIKAGDFATIDAGYSATIKAGDSATIDAGNYATINAGYSATIKAGEYATIKASDYATIDAGEYATIKASDYANCTSYSNTKFIVNGDEWVIINRNVFEVILPKEDDIIQICPYDITGHLVNGFHSTTGKKSIIADGILSEIVKQKGNVYKVINHRKTEETYLVKDGEKYAHGKTLKEAKEALIYKISERDTSQFKDLKLTDKLTLKEFIKIYITITGACSAGTKYFIDNNKLSMNKKYTVSQIIDLTRGQYGHETFKQFFNK